MQLKLRRRLCSTVEHQDKASKLAVCAAGEVMIA
jgi:hypothetical protein